MINSSTSLLPMLTLDWKNGFYYNFSVVAFSLVAAANHVLPENLDGLTHVVKMLFSNLLFSMIGVNPILGFLLSLVDLSPLFTKNEKMKKYGESFLQMPRLLIEIYLMQSIFEAHKLEVIVICVCKVIYYFERKERIKKGIRNDFSSWHAAEHCGLYILFKSTKEVDFSFKSLLVIFFFFVISIGLFLHFISGYLHECMLHRAPEWVTNNSELKNILDEKLKKNRFSKKWRNYIIKPWASHLKLELVTWKSIEDICSVLRLKVRKEDFDMVVGITTGGAFVGFCISRLINLPYFSVRSKFWSEITFKQNFLQTYKFCLGIEQMPNTGKIPDEVKGKRVLLIDDTTYTGISLSGVKKKLFEAGAGDVKTMVMWSMGMHDPDFFFSKKRIPIVWEWGAEVD